MTVENGKICPLILIEGHQTRWTFCLTKYLMVCYTCFMTATEQIIKLLTNIKTPFRQLSFTLGCGGCSNNTTIMSDTSCLMCGRMLCGKSGNFCKEHKGQEESEQYLSMENKKDAVLLAREVIRAHRQAAVLTCVETCWCWEAEERVALLERSWEHK